VLSGALPIASPGRGGAGIAVCLCAFTLAYGGLDAERWAAGPRSRPAATADAARAAESYDRDPRSHRRGAPWPSPGHAAATASLQGYVGIGLDDASTEDPYAERQHRPNTSSSTTVMSSRPAVAADLLAPDGLDCGEPFGAFRRNLLLISARLICCAHALGSPFTRGRTAGRRPPRSGGST
jgi:hypothetical protein